MRKHYIKTNFDDMDYRCIWADFSKDGEIANIGEVFILNDRDSEIYQFFKSETVTIPLPFKKGDLIYSKSWDCTDYDLLTFKRYKNGYIFVGQCCKSENEGFCVKNELDLEFVGKAQYTKVLEQAMRCNDASTVEFIKPHKFLNESEITDICRKI